MKDLRKKTFITIFGIISLFAFVFAFIYNVQIYQKEYQSVLNNITRIRQELVNEDLDNKKVIDYEVYTFILDSNNNIIYKISHSSNGIDNKVLNIARLILNNSSKSKIRIGNLYFTNYAYNLSNGNFLTIVSTAKTKTFLLMSLFYSFLLVILGEFIIYFIVKKITDWITKPVEMSFNREKEFVANASHELKTPLAVMMASIDCLEVSKKNEKWINNLKSEADRMNNLITRLLDLAKSENYLTKENFTINDLSLLVEKRALIFESLAFEKNIVIETNIAEKINFLGHKESLEELVSILIDNAISHSIADSKITINLSQSKYEIKLEVINKGDIILEEDKEKIFERFYRSDKSHNRKSNKYGLGLAIAKNIVESHHGKIRAFSKNDLTVFEVIFKK